MVSEDLPIFHFHFDYLIYEWARICTNQRAHNYIVLFVSVSLDPVHGYIYGNRKIIHYIPCYSNHVTLTVQTRTWCDFSLLFFCNIKMCLIFALVYRVIVLLNEFQGGTPIAIQLFNIHNSWHKNYNDDNRYHKNATKPFNLIKGAD